MHQVSKLQITKLNPHLTCLLCGGYYIEATTIIECLHSFCKSCIVRYLERNKFCPVCEVQVHKTKPLLNIRSDQTLQDIVYKLVPGLFQHEMRLRREFYSKHPNQLPSNPEDRGEVTEQYIYSSDETICLSLEYADDLQGREDVKDENGSQLNGKRFLRCPAAVTVGLLKRLIRGKYGLDLNHALDILYGDSFLCDEYSLVDLAYIYNWRRKGPMRLKYRIYQRMQSSSRLTNGTNGSEEAPQKIKEEDVAEDKKLTNEVQLEISESGVMSVPNVDAKNGISEETQPTIPDTSSEKPEEVKSPSPKPEASSEAPLFCVAVSTDTSIDVNGGTPVNCSTSVDVKTGDSVEVKTTITVNKNPTITTGTTSSDTTSNPPASHLTSSARNKIPSSTSTGHKTLKPPSSSWNQNVNRVGTKRPSSSVACNDGGSLNLSNAEQTLPTPAKRATPSSPLKTPRFFKVRNASQPTDTNGGTCKATGTSIASVTESPVQEVAVNLTKASSSPKKPTDKERSSREGKEGKAPSPRPDSGSNPIRPYSVPVPSQSKRQPSPNLAAEDAAARLRHLLNPISSAASTTTSPSLGDSSVQQLRFPAAAWLNLARGVPNRPVPLALGPGSPFNNRPPLSPAHFISSFIASHPHYPYLSPMGLPPAPDSKKSLPSSTASSSSTVPSPQTHKSISPRTSNSFPTPTFNLNTLQQCTYPSSLSPLLPNLPRELVGSFYHSSYVPRPFMSARGGPFSVSPKSVSSSSSVGSNSSGGGFHPSMPPTVTTTTSNSSSSPAGRKSSPGVRPTVPRRNVAPPPPLVPIGTPSSVRSPPTLLPIKDIVEKESSCAKSTPPAASNCTSVVESCVPQMEEEIVRSGPISKPVTDGKPVDSTSENQHSPAKENGKVIGEADSGKADTPAASPLECSIKKTTTDNANVVLENKSECKVEIAAPAPS